MQILGIDVGGTGIKFGVVDTATGTLIGERERILTPKPATPKAVGEALRAIVEQKGWRGPVGIGFPAAIVGGTVIGRLGMEDQVAAFVRTVPVTGEAATMTRAERLAYAKDQVVEIVHRVWPYVLIGVGIGAAIHNWVPAEVISALLGQDKWWSVPVAVLVGIPMYADIFGTLPIAEALVGKGVGLGTVLAFMMAVTALSLPSLIMLKRVVKMPLLVTFTGVVSLGILSIGLIFNAISNWFI